MWGAMDHGQPRDVRPGRSSGRSSPGSPATRAGGHARRRLRAAAPGQDVPPRRGHPRSGGFMFTATETSEADAVRQFGEALAPYCDEPVPLRFASWDEAITRLDARSPRGPITVVIDEFPFLARRSPGLPSIIQRALDPAARAGNTPVRLLLCGSALSFMGRLLVRQRATARTCRPGARRPDAGLPPCRPVLGHRRPPNRHAHPCDRRRDACLSPRFTQVILLPGRTTSMTGWSGPC